MLGDALQVVFQNLLLESNDEILQSSERVWKLLLQVVDVMLLIY
jgi:TATA-binding protein-associated factor